MDNLTLEQKKAQFDEFFMIAHPIKININLLTDDFVLPELEKFDDVMPFAFRVASEMSTVHSQSLRPLRGLSEHASDLVDYLNLQSRKIDLMMSYILQQQDEPEARFETVKFGGGGLVVHHDAEIPIGTKAELKLFLTEEAAAIFCYGEVITCQPAEDEYHIAFIFNRIREEDQELLVRASLHLQTQQLRKRSQKRREL
ncbi:PilZ domain-containing protein [Alteromonas ponticola]|uniref:PilZ domain-containing protein n=1 Tax=Alteromonas aquimaris TaxID=2998417 RepID=A0ABT3P7S6_9ALTE|nr:PilZ domain-containing protein [Alteromonas aquimaris]MCW8108769.1 PilZ domain-containing protein [Alteromonas aquimaris]